MSQKVKVKVKLFFGLLPAIATLLLSITVLSSYLQPLTVSAQEPEEKEEDMPALNAETLATFGLSEQAIGAAAGSFDLTITQTVNKSSIDSGESITFNIFISNKGPNLISPTLFYNDFPPEMQSVTHQFSPGSEFISNGQSKPWWLSYKPIPVNGTVAVTISGKLVSDPDVTVQNTALVTVTPFHAPEELTPANNQSTVSVQVKGKNPTKLYYFPIIFRGPSRFIVYSDNFSNDNSGWLDDFNVDNCKGGYESNEYRIEADDRSCFLFAPKSAERRTGSFEVDARRRDGGEDEFSYGLYINGKGGEEYYLFRIWPKNNCGWQVVKRDDSKTVYDKTGGCASGIRRDSNWNNLKLVHAEDGTISAIVNDQVLHSFKDNAPLSGVGTGLYVRAETERTEVAFDNFTIYNQ